MLEQSRVAGSPPLLLGRPRQGKLPRASCAKLSAPAREGYIRHVPYSDKTIFNLFNKRPSSMTKIPAFLPLILGVLITNVAEAREASDPGTDCSSLASAISRDAAALSQAQTTWNDNCQNGGAGCRQSSSQIDGLQSALSRDESAYDESCGDSGGSWSGGSGGGSGDPTTPPSCGSPCSCDPGCPCVQCA